MFLIGYAPQSWDALATFLKHKGQSAELATSLGLILPRKTGQGHMTVSATASCFPSWGLRARSWDLGDALSAKRDPNI